MAAYSTRTIGRRYSLDYRVYLEEDGKVLSPFHDIPLYADEQHGVLNMVVEIPRWTNAKFEISRDEPLNPIKQDQSKGEPRFVKSFFPYKGYIWNYGALPQTWEDPSFVHPDVGCKGDNDPLDACEIGSAVAKCGQVKQVKVLGVICLIDGGETDWKTIVLDITDPLASKMNDLDDVDKHMPGLLEATRDWFRVYKIPQGKAANSFALNGEFRDKSYAENVIQECSHAWQAMIAGRSKHEGVNLSNTTIAQSADRIDPAEFQWPKEPDSSSSPSSPPEEWAYINRERTARGNLLAFNI